MAQYAQTGRAFLNRITDTWARLMEPNNAAVPDADIVETALAQAPVVWMLGKVQSGKTSIIKALTNCSDAEVGTGFSPCTRTARMFDFPANVPLLRFLDTRGLGEAHYDAVEDIAFCESRAHLLIVTMRALDPQQRSVVDVVAQVRARHPDWPVIVAQTCLHEGLPTTGRLPMPYPFAESAFERSGALDVVPLDLRRSLTYQRSLFQDVKGTGAIHFIPIDFTQPEDAIAPSDYGRDALFEAIASAAPDALVATLKSLQTAAVDVGAGRLRSQIIGHASVAAAVDVMPLAGAIAVPAVQAKLLKVLGEHYGVGWDRRSLSEFAGCLGVGIVSRLLASLGIRQVAKLVPGYGQTVGAASAAATSFATTFALGQAASYYLRSRTLASFEDGDVAKAYQEALKEAVGLAAKTTPDVAKASKGSHETG